MVWDCIIIGAGASGLYTASHLKKGKVLILEKKHKPALKLGVSGNGQCNITHDGYMSNFLTHYGDKKSFVKYALKAHDNEAVLNFFRSLDIEFIAREDGKIFPKSLSAQEVITALVRQVVFYNGHKINYSEPVINVDKQGDLFVISTGAKRYKCRNLVVATGGNSYPVLGSEGDGYRIASSLGVTVTSIKPGLTGIISEDLSLCELQGMSFNDVTLTLPRINKQFKGDLLITHFGFSGPSIINNSRYLVPGDVLLVNFIDVSYENLTETFLEMINSSGKLPLSHFLNRLSIPDRFKFHMLAKLGISGDIRISEVTKEIRIQLIKHLTQYPIKVKLLQGFDQAMVTVGGIALKDVDSKTMCSKAVERLYFVGEVLDVDGDTGGYNLQWAFSSAYAAASTIENNN